MNKNRDIAKFKMLLWLGIGSIIMLFAGLTSAYIVRQAEGNWLAFNLPNLFWLSTFIIIVSSLTVNWAVVEVKRNNTKKLKKAIIVTIILGLFFALTQFLAWKDLFQNNIVFAGTYSNPAGSFLYVITGLHLAHLIGGLIALVIVLYKSVKGVYNSENTLGVQLCATYWHFLDVLWVYLFLFLLLLR